MQTLVGLAPGAQLAILLVVLLPASAVGAWLLLRVVDTIAWLPHRIERYTNRHG
ncbi:hypothetical protein CUTER_08030 [Corynebacterium uterequi]|uniref:Uncharacterized protein n=2 Tax=Corynebacterium uterequi TaxID=1072256 RepID=A0A0G3HDZ7_9CORY|nr:hypothetical protein CUTER_08030 [Corynebacterium uterequi]